MIFYRWQGWPNCAKIYLRWPLPLTSEVRSDRNLVGDDTYEYYPLTAFCQNWRPRLLLVWFCMEWPICLCYDSDCMYLTKAYKIIRLCSILLINYCGTVKMIRGFAAGSKLKGRRKQSQAFCRPHASDDPGQEFWKLMMSEDSLAVSDAFISDLWSYCTYFPVVEGGGSAHMAAQWLFALAQDRSAPSSGPCVVSRASSLFRGDVLAHGSE